MHHFSSPSAFIVAFLPLIVILLVATIVLKGYALWHAARNSQKGWFVALLVVNTVGILEIVYLIWFRHPSRPDRHISHSHSSAVSSSSETE